RAAGTRRARGRRALRVLAGGSRSLAADVLPLYLATTVLGFGIAIAQPALPVIVREWLTARPGAAPAPFTNGSLLGAVATSWLTIPLVLPLVSNSWRWTLAV